MQTTTTYKRKIAKWQQLLIVSGAILIITGLFMVIVTNVSPHISSTTNDRAFKLLLIGGELLVYGVCIIVATLVILPQLPTLIPLARQRSSVVVGSSMVIVVLLWLPVILFSPSAVIDGERYWWLFDDAMISMRYARNAANGLGLVWNPSERVEGYTNFLWTIYMVLVHLLPLPPSKTSLVIMLTNLVLAIGTIFVIERLVRLLNGGLFVTVGAIVCYIFNRNTMTWAVAGLETTLLTFLVVSAIYQVVRDANNERPSLLTHFLISLVALVRTDAIVLSALIHTMSFLLQKDKIRVLMFTGMSLILPISHILFRWFYYHDLIPNTAYLKVFGWGQRLAAGASYVFSFLLQYCILIGFAIWGALWSKQRTQVLLLGIIVLYTLYVGYVGGDAFYNFRFFVPILPIVFVLAFLGVQLFSFTFLTQKVEYPQQWRHMARVWFVAVFCGATSALLALSGWFNMSLWLVIVALSAVGVWTLGSIELQRWQSATIHSLLEQSKVIGVISTALCIGTTPLVLPGYTTFLLTDPQIEFVSIGLFLHRNTPAESKVAATAAGSIFYFSERYGIDMLGKADRYIARLPVASDGIIPGHNKFDFNYSLGVLRPDFVVADFALPVTEEEMRREARGSTAFIGQLYFNRIFQEHCLPYPLYVGSRSTVVICDWSSYFGDRNNMPSSP